MAAAKPSRKPVLLVPNQGLTLDRSPVELTNQMLQDGLNFRVKLGKLTNLNLGWAPFGLSPLNGPVLLIEDFIMRNGTDVLIFGTATDLYQYNPAGAGSVTYITPRYETGTASASGTAVTGAGTKWNSQPPMGILALGSITAGSGYVTGTYTSVPLTGGTGSGATADITVGVTGVVTAVFLRLIGDNYTVGDTLSASNANLGGSGSGFSIPVSTIQPFNNNVKNGDEISFGAAGRTSPTATWFTILTVNSDTSLTLTASAGSIGSGAYTIRKKFTGALKNPWATQIFINAAPQNEDQWFATNGLDPVVRWNGVANQATQVHNLGFTAGTLHIYSNMMIYGNITQAGSLKPTDIINSDVGQPSLAGAASQGLAGQFKAHGFPDKILRMEKLGDYLSIYSTNVITLAQFVGSPTIFAFRNVVTNKGIIAAKALAKYPSYHEFIGHDAQYSFDGASVRRINNQVWREAIRQQDPVRTLNTFTVLDEQNGDYIWSMPLTTDPNAGQVNAPPAVAFSEHYLESQAAASLFSGAPPTPHSKRSFPFTAAGGYTRQVGITWDQLTSQWFSYNFRWNDSFFSATFPLILVGDNSGNIFTLNTSQDANGAALASFVKFGRRATGDGIMRALVTRVYPYTTKFTAPLNVTVHFADFANGPSTIDATAVFDQSNPEGLFFVPIYRRGRYAEVEFGSAGPGQPWEVTGYDWDIQPGGRR